MAEHSFELNQPLINQLPNEVLLEVFNFFDGKELKVLSLVCKQWSSLIFESSSTMQRLPLNFSIYSEDPVNSSLTRKYHTVRLKYQIPEEMEDFEAISGDIQQLELFYVTFKSIEQLEKLFGCFKHLKKLSLSLVKIDFENSTEFVNLNLRIDELILSQVDLKLLQFLSGLEIIHWKEFEMSNSSEHYMTYNNFIKSQTKLESLEIEKFSEGPNNLFLNENFENFRFNLKKFSILHSDVHETEVFEKNFANFLSLFQQSLQKLKIEGCMTKLIFQIIPTKLFYLHELELRTSELPQEKSFYEFLKPNRIVKILKLNGTIQKSNLQGFLGCLLVFPQIEDIFLADTDDYVANDVFNSMSFRLKHLKNLSVLNFSKTLDARQIFPNLKSLKMRVLNDISQWRTFIALNESLESLNVGWIKRDQISRETVEEIVNLPNLRHLHFGGRFIASKRIYEVIKTDYKNLRTLKFLVANYDEIKVLKFTFPLDKSLWISECQYFDEGFDREPLND